MIFGAPKALSMTTFLPRGPKVTWTASANLLHPSSINALASLPYFMFFAPNERKTDDVKLEDIRLNILEYSKPLIIMLKMEDFYLHD